MDERLQGYKAFKITDGEGNVCWYAAKSEEDARRAHNEDWSPDAALVEEIHEDQLDVQIIEMTDENEEPTGEKVTLRQYIIDELIFFEHGEAFQLGSDD